MIKHVWSIICRRVIVDSNTNNLSISEVLEELRINVKIEKKDEEKSEMVNIPFDFEVVNFWSKDYSKADIFAKASYSIDFFDGKGELLKTIEQNIEMPPGMKRLRSILKVNGLSITGEGEYLFKISLKEENQDNYKLVAEIPLEVYLNKEIIKRLPHSADLKD